MGLMPRKRGRAWGLFIALGLVALVMLLRTERASGELCGLLKEQLNAKADVSLHFGSCVFDPLGPSLALTHVEAKPKNEGWRVSADEARVAVESVFLSRLTLGEVKMTKPQLLIDASRLPKDDGKKNAGGGCALETARVFRVSHLDIKDASVKVVLSPMRSLVLDGVDVETRSLKKIDEVTWVVRSGVFTDGARTLALGRSWVEAEVDLEDETVVLRRAEAQVEGATLSGVGSLEGLCDSAPRMSLNGQLFVPLESVGRVWEMPGVEGRLLGRVTATGRTDAWVLFADLTGSDIHLGAAAPGDFQAKVSWRGKDVVLEDFFTRAGAGEVRASGSLRLETGFPFTAKVATKEASFGRILDRAGVKGSWVEFPATLKGTFKGTVLPSPQVAGDVELTTGRFVLAARAFDAPFSTGRTILTFPMSQTRFHLGINAERTRFEDISVRAGVNQTTRVHGEVTLFHDTRRGLDVRVTADALALSDFGAIAELPWSGQGSGSVAINGPYGAVDIQSQVALRDFTLRGYALGVVQGPIRYKERKLSFPQLNGQKGQTRYAGAVTLDFGPAALHTQAHVDVPQGRTEDLIDIIAGLSPTLEAYQQVLTGEASGTIDIDSPAAQLQGDVKLLLRETQYYKRRLGTGQLMLTFDKGEALVLQPFTLMGPLGRSFAKGRWAFAGPLDFTFSLDKGSLAEALLGQERAPTSADGALTVRGQVSGDTDTPHIVAEVSAPQVQWNEQALGPMAMSLVLHGRGLDINGRLFDGVDARVTGSVKAPYPFVAHADIKWSEWRRLLPPSFNRQGFNGALEGRLDAVGNWAAWRELKANANIDRLTLTRGELAAANEGPVEIAWSNARLDIGKLKIRGVGTELDAEGYWGTAGNDLKLRGTLDLRLLEAAVPSLERAGGTVEFTATAQGTSLAPSVAGNASIRDGRFSIRGYPVSARSLTGHLDFSEARVLVQGLEGLLNEGRVSARGDFRLKDFALSEMETSVDLEEVSYALNPDLPATLTGTLALFGKRNNAQLTGDLDVVRLKYTKPVTLDAFIQNVRSPRLARDDKPAEWLRLSVGLNAGPDVRIDNNLMRANILGKLKVEGTNVNPLLQGTLETAEGAQFFFRGTLFSVSRGWLKFSDNEPTFDLSAQAQVRNYRVKVKAFGRVDDPKVSLTADPALSEADVLSLLTVGVTSSEELNTRAAGGLAADALLSATGLDRQVQRFLTRNVGLKDQQVHLSTTFNEVTGQAEPSVSWEAKALSDKLKIGVTQPVGSTRGTRAQAEYKFNPRLSARAGWDNQDSTSTVGNPGVDLKFRFEWE
ncbi:MAG: translocation/assembly module TamB domain-containing protein [Myxococcaceae bacterium]|nr:translocation/assembly module TamB domain-containing protein [Myxococcaceae bacterium]